MRKRGSQDRLIPFAILVVACVLILVLFAGDSRSRGLSDTSPTARAIVVFSFSVEEEVMADEIIPAFQEHWSQTTGQEVVFQTVFASSEQLTEDILNGAAADIAILSNEQHASWLRINNSVQTDWHSFPQQGISSRSPLVIVVRPGNPLGIEDWADLAHPGVRLVHPDPRSSGGAQWALLAEYGSALLGEGKAGREMAHAQLQGIWTNVVTAPASSREALRQFVFGVGDALVTYEQDALLAQARGAALQVVMPQSTIMSEHVVVIVDPNVKSWEREVVEAFVSFLWSDTAQEAFTRYYFHAVTDETLNEAVPEFQEIDRPFTVHDLGGWGEAYPGIIRGIWEEQILAED